MYCGSWLGGVRKDVKLLLHLVLAPDVHRQLGKEMGKAEQAKTSWIKETDAFHRGVKYASGPGVGEADPAGGSGRGHSCCWGHQSEPANK